MMFIVFTTARCNLNCIYCGGLEESVMPMDITYNLDDLVNFIESDKNPSVAFYGGEPLLNVEFVKKVMDKINAEHFVLQTNGLLLKKLGKDYLKRFSTILVSIDGRKSVTEFYKGRIYDRILENVNWLRKFYEGELIARMVASDKTDIYLDVKHLLGLNLFSRIHWQIDAIWGELRKESFERWSEKYKLDLGKLINELKEKPEDFFRIVPFAGVLSGLEHGNLLKPPCGSGSESFAITTDGRVVACPVCSELEWNNVGTIYDDPKNLRKVEPVDPCPSCDLFNVCGSRCLFSNREWLWGEWGFKKLCELTRALVNELEKVREELKEKGYDIPLYPPYLNTTEIIP